MITVLSVKEMCCPVEGRAVEKALRAIEGVEEILCDYAARSVRVTHGSTRVEELVREVEKLGMSALVLEESPKSEVAPISVRVPEMDCPVEAAQIEKAFAARGLPKASFDTERRVVRVAANYVADSGIQGISKDTVLGHHGVGIFWNIQDWTIEE